MYKYKTIININEQDEYSDFKFGIRLQSGTRFKLMNCYVEFKRGNTGRYSERLNIEYYSDIDDKKNAYKEISRCIDCLTFIFAIPLGLDRYVNKKEVEEYLPVENLKSKTKVDRVNYISRKILRFNKVKDLFYYNIKMFSMAFNHNFIYGYNEHSYLDFFKIIENMANNEFGINKQNLKFNNDNIKLILVKLFKDTFNVKFTKEKIDDITGKVAKNLLELSTNNTYFNIYWFLAKYKIGIEPELLKEMIEIRNCIAHGQDIEFEKFKKCYGKVMELSAESISMKFFYKRYSEISITSSVD